MGLFDRISRWAKSLRVRQDNAHFGMTTRRTRQFELVEPRQMLSSVPVFDPIRVGATYVEGDTGTDNFGDTFEINFVGGGPSTQLNRVIISGDKAFNYEQFLLNPQAAALKNLDVFFDTVEGGPGDNLGKDHASPPAITVLGAQGIGSYSFSVIDGTSLLVIDFTGFDAGEKFIFTVDVDQVIDLSENPVIEGLDAITSGVEFQNSSFVATFSAPNFKDTYGVGKFRDAYDNLLAGKGLNLTPDNGPINGQGIRDRSAGVGLNVNQAPKPITIAGTVFHDRDLDLVREPNANPSLDEHGIDGVSLSLWKLNETTQQYEFTGHTTVTANGGKYAFGANLNLTPGTFQVREGAAAGYFDVGAIPGTVQGAGVGSTGASDPMNVLTAIFIPLGDQHAVNYDFAEAKLAQISGYVYHDVDNDGNFEPNDPTKPEIGLGGIRMLIQPMDWPLPGQGNPPATPDFGPNGGRVTGIVTTNPDGSYTFTGMRPGTYRIIQLDQHPDYSDGKETAGTVDGILVGAAINPLEPGRIDTIALGSGSTGINYNFGEIIIPVSIKGNVHLTARDGTCFDDNIVFVGVEGVKVELYDANGSLLKTTFTDANGDYSFDQLPPGTYSIREYTPTYLLDGGQRAGQVNGVWTGAVAGTDATKGYDEITGITLKSGQNGVKYDFCEHEPITIAGFVYHDKDNDGLKEGGENGIANTTVQLWRKSTDANGVVTMTLVGTQLTAADGSYKFLNVPFSLDKDGVKNELLLREIQPGADANAPHGWLDGKEAAGTGMYVDGVSTVNDEFRSIQAGWGDDGVNYNFGEILPVSIAGYVYHDRDNDGVREAGNEGLGGSTIQIVAVNTMLPQANVTVVTNPDGSYLVTGLSPGEYLIRQLTQPTRTVSGVTQTFLDGKDTAGFVGVQQRGNTLLNEQIRQIVLTQGEATVENNFGELLPASISGRVYISGPDGNCELPEGTDPEHPLPNVKVDLYKVENGVKTLLATTFTNQGGVYFFDNLLPGAYEVVEHTPPELLDGGEMIGSHGGVVLSDAVRDSVMGDIHLSSGDAGIEYDFCEKLPASISGYVYHDRDNDGNKETGEEGISGVTMSLIDLSTGQVIGVTTTSANGYYEFTRLRKGDYKVVEGNPGPQWRDGKDTPGQIVRLGTTISVGVGTSIEPDTLNAIPILFGDKGQNYNFGEYLPASISGRVYISDPDGSCELPEGTDPARPLAGVRVDLYKGDPIPANFVKSVFTDQFGVYRFDGLDPGEYSIVEFTPANLLDGGEIIGSHGGIVLSDSVRDSVMGDIHLKSGDNGIEYDFCEKEPAKISGFVYHDRDNDGVKEAGEEGISGVVMTLVDVTTNSIVATTTTAADGSYLFDRLRKGSYKILEGNPGPLWIDGKDAAGTIARLGGTFVIGQAIEPDTIQQIEMIFADVGINYNFGEYLPSSIAGHVFWDVVEDCELPPGTLPQNPIANVTVELRNAAGQVIATTLTDASGRYRFDNLAPGTYTVHEIQPAGFFHDGQHHGYVFKDNIYDHGPGDDSTQDVVSGIQITSGQTLVHYDFCEEPSSTISGYVFQDGAPIFRAPGAAPITADEIAAQRDGVLTPDDIRIPGVTLELRYTFGGAPVMGSEALSGLYGNGPIRTVTDANGYYQFTGLRAGNYTVVQVHPNGFIDSIDTAGLRDGLLNGVALNRVSDISPAIFGGWATQPKLDTIGLIGLPPGTHAVQNNFSEVVVYTFPPEDWEPEPPPPMIVAPIPYLPPAPPILPPSDMPTTPNDPSRGPPVIGYTWHLSVVDAGHPRQFSQTGNAEIFVNASTAARINAWTGRTLNEGAWKFGDRETTFGLAGGAPVVGDFNGDGVDEVGFYFEGEWFIDVNGNGVWDQDDLWAKLGDEKDRPVAGDWDGDGKDDIGIFGPIWSRDPVAIRHEPGLPDPANPHCDRPKNLPPEVKQATQGSRTLQRSMQGSSRQDLIDHVFLYGQAGDKPIAGDWNGDGISQIGIYRKGQWQLDTNGDGRFTPEDQLVTFGQAGDRPVVGDWTGNGVDRIGVYRNGTWILDTNGNYEIDAADKVFELGGATDIPVVGDWDGDGVDEPALYRGQMPARVARAQ